jgi:hypothetical protein
MPEGQYIVHFMAVSVPWSFPVVNTDQTDYYELSYLDEVLARAPNLYLYPESDMMVSIEIEFPQNGKIIESTPAYNDGWYVHATPEGLIDNKYDYLFYEAALPVPLNHEYGWLIEGTNLESRLRAILTGYGFISREIDDFIEYWIPELGHWPWYAIYPQDVESMVTLNITPAPDNIIRALYLIRPVHKAISIQPPPDPIIKDRNGFTAAEWGVILITE